MRLDTFGYGLCCFPIGEGSEIEASAGNVRVACASTIDVCNLGLNYSLKSPTYSLLESYEKIRI